MIEQAFKLFYNFLRNQIFLFSHWLNTPGSLRWSFYYKFNYMTSVFHASVWLMIMTSTEPLQLWIHKVIAERIRRKSVEVFNKAFIPPLFFLAVHITGA